VSGFITTLEGNLEQQLAVNPEIMRIASLYVTIIIAIIATGATIVGSIAFFRAGSGQAKTFSLLVQRAGALQLITVMSIIGASCFLAVIGKVSPEGTISILSGIAGYVLGGYAARTRGSSDKDEDSEE
jgi:cadmium resistance protein CadD (predicted permease)